MAPAPAWDRFAEWPRGRAVILLIAVVAMLIAAGLVPLTVGKGEVAKPPPMLVGGAAAAAQARPRDDDLKLYDIAIARIRRGENYYRFIVAEHRRAHYPVRPGVAVRLPTLAYVDAALGVDGDATAPWAMAAAVALMAAVVWAWWSRLGEEACDPAQRRFGAALMFLGGSLGLNRYYFVLHELWAGMLLALSFGLHRPLRRRWIGAWMAAAAGLAIREHVLPLVMLMAVHAAWRRAWREGAAWFGLIGFFAIGLAVHLSIIDGQVVASDPVGPSWLALRGLGGFLSDVVLSSNLRFLPHWVAGPAVIAMMLGWAGWRSAAGAFGTLLYCGYACAFMLAGRDDNFYWGAVIAPAMFIGLAFLPMAAGSLVRVASQGGVGAPPPGLPL